ncbi:MAG: hypothetical protein AAFZ18_09190 [Myxococcota bacterium]
MLDLMEDGQAFIATMDTRFTQAAAFFAGVLTRSCLSVLHGIQLLTRLNNMR